MTGAGLFNRQFAMAAGSDIGLKRHSNQDQVICCPDYGFFAVSDGMGGLARGGETSLMIAQALPGFIEKASADLLREPSPALAATLLQNIIRLISDNIYENINKDVRPTFGATLCGMWLIGDYVVCVNLGDSRGYHLGYYKKLIRQVTNDHNLAAVLIANGELNRDEACRHHSSYSALTRFVGMKSPASPETFIRKVERGDRLLLCSDGLYGMVEEARLPKLMRSSKSNNRVVERLISEANIAGGSDNISVVFIKILK